MISMGLNQPGRRNYRKKCPSGIFYDETLDRNTRYEKIIKLYVYVLYDGVGECRAGTGGLYI